MFVQYAMTGTIPWPPREFDEERPMLDGKTFWQHG
jgi:hypothetical protein